MQPVVIDSTQPNGMGAVVAMPNATALNVTVGNTGTGTLTIANGGTVSSPFGLASVIGSLAGSQGTVTVTGAGSTWTQSNGSITVG
jgi:T5SS/PEP-CTERM-associated repeat protein